MTIKVPKITFDIVSAQEKIKNAAQRILFIGQKVSTGTAEPLTIIEDIPNDKSWDTLFGATSMLAGMIRNAKKVNTETRMDAIAVEDNIASTEAVGSVTIDSIVSGVGTATLYVGSRINHSYTISIGLIDDINSIASKFETVINADTNRIVEAVAALNVVTLTAKNAGLEGNSIGLEIETKLSSGTVGISIIPMNGGTVSPSILDLPDIIGNLRYQHIVIPQSYDIYDFAIWLDSRFNVSNDIRNGTLFLSATDTVVNLKTYANNYKSNISCAFHANKKVEITDKYYGSALFELDTVIASQIASIAALRLTDNSNISRLTTSTYGSRDAFGGIHLSSKPYHNTPFFNLPLIDSSLEMTDEEQKELNEAGMFFLGNNRERTTIIAGDILTTYRFNPVTSEQDDSFKYQNYVDTISAVREYFVNNSRERFAQSRLTAGEMVAGLDMVNNDIVSAYMNELYEDLTNEALTVKGNNALRFFNTYKTVTTEIETGKVMVIMQVPIVTQMRELIGVIQISFTLNLQLAT